jgi:hypothetical protein
MVGLILAGPGSGCGLQYVKLMNLPENQKNYPVLFSVINYLFLLPGSVKILILHPPNCPDGGSGRRAWLRAM